MKNNNKIIQIKEIVKKYQQKDSYVTILDKINIDIAEGEIIGILGRSGSGKSTLLRIISSLIEPTSGSILYNNKPIKEADPKISMIFQSFGLIPWLTVFENIALGLEEQNLSKLVIKDKVLNAIGLVGLRGYEEAYPKEMSGGMRQRVGFARALVVDPEILLMDEPFSALDYLTANTLKDDLLDLWFERNILSIKTIVIVTHSIEEAVSLCDRVIILSSNPGKVIANVPIDIAHPRDINSQKFHDTMDSLYLAMTNTKGMQDDGDSDHNLHKYYPQQMSMVNLFYFMLSVKGKVNENKADIKLISEELKLTHEQIVIFIEVLSLLKFIEIEDGNIILSSAGRIILDADYNSRKIIFKEHLVKYVPFISNLYHKLQDSSNAPISKTELLTILQKKFSNEQATKILTSMVSWTRYAGLFSYDNIKEELSLNQNIQV